MISIKFKMILALSIFPENQISDIYVLESILFQLRLIFKKLLRIYPYRWLNQYWFLHFFIWCVRGNMVFEMEFKELWLYFYLMYWRHKNQKYLRYFAILCCSESISVQWPRNAFARKKKGNTSKTSSTSMHIKPS